MKSAILTNTLNKLELEPGEAGDKKRNIAINDIIAVLQRSFKEYYSTDDGQRKNQISDLILEHKTQIIDKLREMIQGKGIAAQGTLMSRILSGFELAKIDIENSIKFSGDEIEKRSKENVKLVLEEIISFMSRQMEIEANKEKIELKKEDTFPVPVKKENMFQIFWKKIRSRFSKNVPSDEKQNTGRDKTAKKIREYVFVDEEKEKTKTVEFKQQLQSFQSNQGVPYQNTDKPIDTRGYIEGFGIQQPYQNTVSHIEAKGYIPGFGIQQPTNNAIDVKQTVKMPHSAIQQSVYTKPSSNTLSVRRPIQMPEYSIQPPVSSRIQSDYFNTNDNGGFVKSFEELGISPNEVEKGQIIKKNGKTYKRLNSDSIDGLIEFIDSNYQEGETR